MRFFNGFEHFGHIEGTELVQTRRLDDVEGLPAVDFLKMDIQGAELTVLKNGVGKLANCLAVQLEVSYICLYEHQPTFGEVDVWMRSPGLSAAVSWTSNDGRCPDDLRQQLQGARQPAARVRHRLRQGPHAIRRLDANQLAKFAALAHHALRSTDLCVHILLEMERRQLVEPDAHLRYLESLR